MVIDRLKKKISKGRHASTIKRARQAEKREARNKKDITRIKTAIKKVRVTKSASELAKAIPIIAKGAKKGIIHRKKASRLISRLTHAVNNAAT